MKGIIYLPEVIVERMADIDDMELRYLLCVASTASRAVEPAEIRRLFFQATGLSAEETGKVIMSLKEKGFFPLRIGIDKLSFE